MQEKRRRKVLVLTVAALGLLLSGCDDAVGPLSTPLEELEAHRTLWAGRRPDVYVYTILRSCTCLPAAAGPVSVTVDGQAVVARVYNNSRDPVPEHLERAFPSVEGLFDIAHRALADGQDLTVRYDHHSGVPLEVRVEPSVGEGGDELGYRVTLPPTRPADAH